LEPVAERYGMMIVDLPGPSATGAEVAAAAELDAVLLVVEAETTRIHTARRITQQLSASGANVLGVVLNGRRHYIPEWLYRRL
jgi:Mrp family chromosome partitioning ATPase